MGTGLFKHIPNHVTYLFTFLCICQVLLLFHISRTSFKSSPDLPISTAKILSSESQGSPLSAVPLHGKLRLLWSMKSNSNEGQDQNVFQINQDSPAERETSINQSNSYIPVHTHQPPNQDGLQDNEQHGLYLRDYIIHYIINQQYLCHGPEGSNGVNREEMDDWLDGEEVSPAPFMLVLVHSHPSHKAQRDAIRDTWGQIRKDYDRKLPVRIVFILGLRGPEYGQDYDMKGPEKESRMYQDIVVGNFTDTYHNLTLKSLVGLQWAQQFCPEVQYVMKTDDDVYFNLPNLIQLLFGQKDKTVHMLGSLNVLSQVQRHGRWQVTDAQFPHKTYPPYCSGCGYVLSQDILPSLLTAANKVAMLPIEDVYITGLLANVTGIQCQSSHLFPQWYMGPSPKHICLLLSRRIFGLHNMPYEKMYFIHKKLVSGHVCKS